MRRGGLSRKSWPQLALESMCSSSCCWGLRWRVSRPVLSPLSAAHTPSLRQCLNQLPQRPQRLRIFHSGSNVAVTERRADQQG